VIIVNFHCVGAPPRDLDPGERSVWVTSDTLKAILDMLAERSDMRVTFDDGNLSDLDTAAPALRERGIAATFFVCAGRLNEPHFLSGPHLRELVGLGMAIGSHGWSHVPWTAVGGANLVREIREARARLEEETGESTITEAACPFGAYNRRVLRSLWEAGFERAYTSDRAHIGRMARVVPRFTVHADDTPESVERWFARPSPLHTARDTARCLVKRWR